MCVLHSQYPDSSDQFPVQAAVWLAGNWLIGDFEDETVGLNEIERQLPSTIPR